MKESKETKDEGKPAEFYEAMPATMDRMPFTQSHSARSYDRRKFLPLLLVPLAAIIGLAVWKSSSHKSTTDKPTEPEQ